MLRFKRFKIARRLGPGVFEQTQTERFALSEERKRRSPAKDKHKKSISAYNLSLRDKQRVRFYYGVSERQFSRYVKEAGAREGNPALNLFEQLEMRLDNIVYKVGLAPTHRAARQLVSHGHITVNGKKIKVASHTVSVNDVIAVRAGSATKKVFLKLEETKGQHTLPLWVTFDEKKNEWKLTGKPGLSEVSPAFNLFSVVEYYSR